MTSIFRGDIRLPREDVFISGSGDFRPIVVVRPFIDPPNSFRAETVSDMFFLSPGRERFSTLEFDVGLDPNIDPIIVSIQNRCLNAALRVNLTLPSYVRSNLGTEFLVPAIGDTITPPIVFFDRTSRVGPAIGEDEFSEFSEGFRRLQGFLGADAPPDLVSFPTVPDRIRPPVGAGKGLINVTLTFNEAQAKTFNPGIESGKIIFDMFPNEPLTGPIFVSTTVGKPADLNVAPELEFPIDDNEPIVTGSVDPPLLVVTESIEVEKLVPTLAPGFTAGTSGTTDKGVKFGAGEVVEGPAPSGWVTQADGKSYPPIIPEIVCDPITGAGPDGTALENIPEAELTPLQKLLLSVKDRPPTFGTLNKRRGFVIEPKPFFRGNASNLDTVIRFTPQLVVADSIPGRSDFKIIASRTTGLTLTDKFTSQVNKELDLVIAARKEGNNLGSPIFGTREQRRLFFETLSLKKIIDDGERIEIKDNTDTAEELQVFRVIAPAASILFALKNEGAG